MDIKGLLKVIIKQEKNKNTTEIKINIDRNKEEIERLIKEGLKFK